MFSAGVSKLLNGGFRWMDGWTLHSYVTLFLVRHDIAGGRWLWFMHLLIDHPWMCQVLSFLTIVLELGAPAALFSRKVRHIVVLSLALFHVGINLAMGPNFFANIITYALLVDWDALLRRPRTVVAPNPAAPMWAPMVGLAQVSIVVAVAFLQIVWWPVHNFNMFSNYLRLGQPPSAPDRFGDVQFAQEVARKCAVPRLRQFRYDSWCATEAAFGIARKVEFRIAGGETCSVRYGATERTAPGVRSIYSLGGGWCPLYAHRQWAQSVQEAVYADLAEKPLGDIGNDALTGGGPAAHFLEGVRGLFRADLQETGCESLEMRYLLDSGPVVIARTPLSGTDVAAEAKY
jgi:hypothetical protein